MKLNRRSSFLTRSVLLAALCTASVACVDNKDGEVYSATPGTFNITFSGHHSEPNYPIHIQMLADPEGPIDPSSTNWVNVGPSSITTGTTPFVDDFGTTSYAWSATVPSTDLAPRWPAGGILRWRVLDGNGPGNEQETTNLDFDECYNEEVLNGANDWATIRDNCASPWNNASFVSSSLSPTQNNPPPPYISWQTIGSVGETDLYYNAIGAPGKLSDPNPANPANPGFKQRFGFGTVGSDEVSAVYYNAGDLAVGREMHCKTFANDPVTVGVTDPGVACFVSNYDVDTAPPFFTGVRSATDRDTILANTAYGLTHDHAGAFATVAMWYTSPITANNSVRFVVYDQLGNKQTSAALDSTGQNTSIPQNCIACHGGADYDYTNHRVLGASATQNGARFLPFDLNAFEFPGTGSFTRAAQEENFRKLNAMVYGAGASNRTKELITGWYSGNVNTPNRTQNSKYIPASWSNDPASPEFAVNGIKRADAKIYRDVYAPYCRGCHASQSGDLSFNSANGFRMSESLIMYRICGSHEMPHAEVTLDRFWKSPARAYLFGFYDSEGGCNP